LKEKMEKPRFEIVLARPDIPGNTGQIGRSCMALNCRLHLIHPLGYIIDDKHLKRAGLDYWPMLDKVEHADTAAWMQSVPEDAEVFLMSTKADRLFEAAEVKPGAYLVFGSETQGMPAEISQRFPGRARRLDMDARARSLNLSASVAMTLGALVFGKKV
jgi:tRNA (cytidine/uridine-2'-O-)-methyltransferase